MVTDAPEIPAASGHHAPPHTVAEALALLHNWIDFVPRQQRRLGLFICFALAVHVAAFFFIRIDAARAEMQHPIRIHVTMENSHPSVGVEESDSFFDSLTDPRLFLLPVVPLNHLPPDEGAPDLSAINLQPETPHWPAAAPGENHPLVHAVAPSLQQEVTANMHPARQPFSYDETVPPPMTKTSWQWGADLAARPPAVVPDLPSPVSDTDLNPTELRVAINADGSVEHVLLEETCQKPELDQQAILAARKLRFGALADSGIVWGHVTVFWRSTSPPREVVEPTPPTTGP